MTKPARTNCTSGCSFFGEREHVERKSPLVTINTE